MKAINDRIIEALENSDMGALRDMEVESRLRSEKYWEAVRTVTACYIADEKDNGRKNVKHLTDMFLRVERTFIATKNNSRGNTTNN